MWGVQGGARGAKAVQTRFLDPNQPGLQKVETTLISVEVSPPPPASRTTTPCTFTEW